MKKILLLTLLAAIICIPASAQSYKRSKYYNSRTGRLDYSHRTGNSYSSNSYGLGTTDAYYGFRVGPAFTTVSSDKETLNGSGTKTGLNIGFAAGFGLTSYAPLYLESGIYYTEKGGNSKNHDGKKFTYNLDYIELPFVFKYVYSPDGHLTIEPHFGGYLACGISGKTKDYGDREAFSSFDSDKPDHFKRLDGGLRFGCGVGYDMFYAELTYDLGLANIGNDNFDETKNRALMLNFGINF